MIRKFRLYNSRQDLFDLTDNKDFIGFSPKGLGVALNNEFHNSGASQVIRKRELESAELELFLVIGYMQDNAYARYTEFVQFLNHSPYVLEYEFDGRTYRRDCILSELSKEELRMSRTLQETLKLEFTSPFYIERTEQTQPYVPIQGKAGKIYEELRYERRIFESVPESYRAGDIWHYSSTIEGIPEELSLGYYIAHKSNTAFDFNDFEFYNTTLDTQDKTYDYIYDYTYGPDLYVEPVEVEFAYTYDYIYDEEGEGNSFTIDNNSVYMGVADTSPCEITIYGPCVNPHWDITQGTKIVQSDGYNLTIPEGYRLVVSSHPNRQRAQLIARDGTVSNVYQQQDLSKTNFVRFPVGRSKILFFNYDRVTFKYREEYVVI